MVKWDEQLKAIVAGLVAGLSFAIPVVDDGVEISEALGIALAALTGWQATYWTPRMLKRKAHKT